MASNVHAASSDLESVCFDLTCAQNAFLFPRKTEAQREASSLLSTVRKASSHQLAPHGVFPYCLTNVARLGIYFEDFWECKSTRRRNLVSSSPGAFVLQLFALQFFDSLI